MDKTSQLMAENRELRKRLDDEHKLVLELKHECEVLKAELPKAEHPRVVHPKKVDDAKHHG